MFIKSFSLSAAILACVMGIAQAGPLVRRASGCKPNFQGNTVSAFGYYLGHEQVNEWTTSPTEWSHVALKVQGKDSFRIGEFLVEFSGQPTNTYIIKQVADTQRDLKALATSSGEFVFSKSNSGTQQFEINCGICRDHGDVFIHANYCTITDPKTDLCLTGSTTSETTLS
ncbi:hypothetical protein BD779DRAFT_1802368, partial [Infundibulicybe gibba]